METIRGRTRSLFRRPTFSALWVGAIRRPWIAVSIALLLLPLLLAGARRIGFERRIDLLSASDPVAHDETARRRAFGENFRILVALRKTYREGGVMREAPLRALADLHGRLEHADGVRRVASLVNAPALVGSAAAAAGAPLWPGPDPPRHEVLIEALSASKTEKSLFLNALWSLTPVYLETDPAFPEDRLVAEVRRIADEVEAAHPGAGEIAVVGPAVVETGLAGHVFDDLKGLVPFSIAVAAMGFLLIVRRPRLLVIAVLHSTVLVSAVLGGMAALGWTVNLVSVLAPVILVPVGISDFLHLSVRLESGLDETTAPGRYPANARIDGLGGVRRLIASAYGRLEPALLGSDATTALGFLGFVISPVAAIRQFGIVMSAGTILSLLLTFTLDASMLSLLWKPRPLPARARPRPGPRRATGIERWIAGLLRSPRRLRRALAAGAAASAAIVALGIWAIPRLGVDDTWIQNFDAGSRIARDTIGFETDYVGTNLLAVVIEADPSVAGARDRAIALVERATTELGFLEGTRGAVSATLLARSLDPAQEDPWIASAPPDANTLAARLDEWTRRGPPLPRTAMLADEGLRRFQVLIFVLNQPYRDLLETVEEVRARIGPTPGAGVVVSFAGDLMTNLRMVHVAVTGQGVSLAVLLTVMTAFVLLGTRSAAWSLVMMIPLSLGILATYVVLVVLGVPHGVAVSMFPTLVLGSAIDFAIHVRAAFARSRGASSTARAREVGVAVRGIVLNGSLWMTGFAVLTFSRLPPNRYLGLLCATVFCLSMLLTILWIPTALVLARRSEQPAARANAA